MHKINQKKIWGKISLPGIRTIRWQFLKLSTPLTFKSLKHKNPIFNFINSPLIRKALISQIRVLTKFFLNNEINTKLGLTFDWNPLWCFLLRIVPSISSRIEETLEDGRRIGRERLCGCLFILLVTLNLTYILWPKLRRFGLFLLSPFHLFLHHSVFHL